MDRIEKISSRVAKQVMAMRIGGMTPGEYAAQWGDTKTVGGRCFYNYGSEHQVKDDRFYFQFMNGPGGIKDMMKAISKSITTGDGNYTEQDLWDMNQFAKYISQEASAKPKPMETKWGFDLVSFVGARGFANVLAAAGISASQEPGRGHIGEFIWKGSGIVVVTGNNPITGEYMTPGRRESEPGYAGYMGIEGNSDKVARVVAAVKKYGDYKDESPGSREFI
jgi:hypothetical protein